MIIALVIVLFLAAAGVIGWTYLAREHREAAALPIAMIDFSRLNDGVYTGAYEGGMYKWRANEARVTVEGGRVTDIELVRSGNVETERAQAEKLYGRIVAAQSLQVDAVSGATLTCKGYLKAVENALVQAGGA